MSLASPIEVGQETTGGGETLAALGPPTGTHPMRGFFQWSRGVWGFAWWGVATGWPRGVWPWLGLTFRRPGGEFLSVRPNWQAEMNLGGRCGNVGIG